MIALGGFASTSAVLDWTAYRKRAVGRRVPRWDCATARRALEQIGAERVRRVPPHGAWVWRLRECDTDAT
jgi:hypothetical protein